MEVMTVKAPEVPSAAVVTVEATVEAVMSAGGEAAKMGVAKVRAKEVILVKAGV